MAQPGTGRCFRLGVRWNLNQVDWSVGMASSTTSDRPKSYASSSLNLNKPLTDPLLGKLTDTVVADGIVASFSKSSGW